MRLEPANGALVVARFCLSAWRPIAPFGYGTFAQRVGPLALEGRQRTKSLWQAPYPARLIFSHATLDPYRHPFTLEPNRILRLVTPRGRCPATVPLPARPRSLRCHRSVSAGLGSVEIDWTSCEPAVGLQSTIAHSISNYLSCGYGTLLRYRGAYPYLRMGRIRRNPAVLKADIAVLVRLRC